VSWDPLMKCGWGIVDLDVLWMDKTLHLLILMFNYQDIAHDDKRSRDCWSLPQLKTLTLTDENSLTSSTKILSSAWPIKVDETSFIYIKNKTRPRTEPYGTPLSTQVTLEKQLSNKTHCSLLSINAYIKFSSYQLCHRANRLQLVLNSAARAATKTSKLHHIVHILKSLHWSAYRIKYKVLSLAYKSQNWSTCISPLSSFIPFTSLYSCLFLLSRLSHLSS